MTENTGLKILLVEDEQAIRDMVSFTLVRAGFQVSEAEDTRIAMERINSESPDLILLEITISGFDGRQTIKKIREISRVPIIVITNERNEMVLTNTLNCGADDLIRKPFKINILLGRVQARLAKSSVKS